MENYTTFIYDAWETFTQTGVLVPGVKKEIRESWERCKKHSVNFMDGRGDDRNRVSIERLLTENIQLISVAHSIMENIYEIVKGSGFALFLSDCDGYILDVIGDPDILLKAEDLRFVRGALWTEAAVGTNAIGTAIYLGKPIQTVGAEHFGAHQHSWTCSAAPIYDEDHNLIGCINMSGNFNQVHLHTLGIVISAAKYIQKQLALAVSHKMLNTTFDSVSEGMIVLDKNQNIKEINHRACAILEISRLDVLRKDMSQLLKNVRFADVLNTEKPSWSNVEWDFYGKNGPVKCIMNVACMQENGRSIGFVISFSEATQVHKLVNKMVGYKATYQFDDFITRNSDMQQVVEFAKKAAHVDCNILIEGESGTGKEVLAQSIHTYSKRRQGPFVAVNCASIPRELVESELFGYDRGAFTGASKEGHPGKFELADSGTVFLDEIGELPLDIQAKLLRVLDNSTISRIGSTREKQLDVRVICATNRILKEEVLLRNFREDLYYRLNVVTIQTIPLRERKEDIEAITENLIDKLNIKNGENGHKLGFDYVRRLKEYDWPGNVRELRNAVERDYYFGENTNHHDNPRKENTRTHTESPPLPSMKAVEEENIRRVLGHCGGNIVAACKILTISRATLYRKIRKYGIIVE